MSENRFPARFAAQKIARMDLIGHSLASEGGATQVDFGMWHKIASHLQPALINSIAQGGARAALPEGQKMYTTDAGLYGGFGRVYSEFTETQRGAIGPYLPTSQLVCIWHGGNDVSWLGPSPTNLGPFKEALRAIIARTRAAVIFDSSATTPVNGITPVTYTPAWASLGGVYGFASGGEVTYTPSTYPTAKITAKIPPDYGAGVLQVGFTSLENLTGITGGGGALWDIVDVTAGGSVVLATGVETRDLGGTSYLQPTTNASSAQPAAGGRRYASIVRRYTLGPAPTTTLTARLKSQDTTATVADTSAFDSAGVIDIGNERISYTGKTATTLTGLVRGVSGSYVVSHPVGRSLTGTRTIEFRPTAVTANACFDFWGLEAPTAPITYVMLQNRVGGYSLWANSPYAQSKCTVASGGGSGTNTVTLSTTTVTGAHTAAVTTLNVGSTAWMYGSETWAMVGTELMFVQLVPSSTSFSTSGRGGQNTTAVAFTGGETVKPWVRVGDTINVGGEIRTVTAYSAAGQVTVDSNFSSSHSAGEEVIVGIQDYDVRQRCNAITQAVVDEFADRNIFTIDPEAALFPEIDGPMDYTVWSGDGVHFSDEGHSRLAAYFLQLLDAHAGSLKLLARPTVEDRMAYWDSLYGMVTFSNGWSSYQTVTPAWACPSQNLPAPFGFRKDFITRRVRLRGALKCTSYANSSLTALTLPPGFRPAADEDWLVNGSRLQIRQSGVVIFPDGVPNYGYVPVNLMFEAGG